MLAKKHEYDEAIKLLENTLKITDTPKIRMTLTNILLKKARHLEEPIVMDGIRDRNNPGHVNTDAVRNLCYIHRIRTLGWKHLEITIKLYQKLIETSRIKASNKNLSKFYCETLDTIFNQLLQILPRHEFEKAVNLYKGDKYVKYFSSWQQFMTMLYAQIRSKDRLRDIRFRK